METEKELEKWLAEAKEQIREEATRGEYNSYRVGYHDALCQILWPSPTAMKESGVELWERTKKEMQINAAKSSKSSQTPVCGEKER